MYILPQQYPGYPSQQQLVNPQPYMQPQPHLMYQAPPSSSQGLPTYSTQMGNEMNATPLASVPTSNSQQYGESQMKDLEKQN